jgi:hypothetical protein
LALIADEFSDRVGFITLLVGWESDRNDAIDITDSVNASFITVDAFDDDFAPLFDLFESGSIPEILLIDGYGNVIESIVGGDSDVYRTAIENALNR